MSGKRKNSKTPTEGDQQELSLQDVFRAIQQLQEDLRKTKDDLTAEIKKTVREVVKEAVASELSGIQASLTDLEGRITRQEKNVGQLSLALLRSEERRLMSERKALSRNLIVRGIEEGPGESSADLKNNMCHLFSKIDPNVPIINAERIGKPVPNRRRLIRVRLNDFKDRNLLLGEARKHRDGALSNIFLSTDRPYEDRKEAARLRLKMKQLKEANPDQEFKILRGKLLADDTEIDRESPQLLLLNNARD